MKRIHFLVMSLLVALSSFAREDTGHFEFCGVPIDSRMEIFVGKCNAKGFSVLENKKFTTLLSGTYGDSYCRVLVERLPKEDCVWGLTVIFPAAKDWEQLYSRYKEYKDSLSQAYGDPVHCVEYFHHEGKGISDAEKFEQVQQDACSYKSVFDTKNGQIDVVIWHDDVNGSYVLMSFIDLENSKKQE